MNIATIIIITLISALTLYLVFLVIGVGGIAKNLKAQGLEKKNRNE